MISHQKKIIFIHIPKTGGTSIEDALVDETSECKKDMWDERIRTTPLNHLTMQEMLAGEFIDLPTAKSYFKFCVVRNPWSRVVSEISYTPSLFAGDTFSEKVASLCEIKNHGNHMRPQVDFVRNQYGIEMDMIGRFESLEANFKRACTAIGLPSTIQLQHKNKSNHNEYQSYYDDQTRELVAVKYKEDIEAFGYHF